LQVLVISKRDGREALCMKISDIYSLWVGRVFA